MSETDASAGPIRGRTSERKRSGGRQASSSPLKKRSTGAAVSLKNRISGVAPSNDAKATEALKANARAPKDKSRAPPSSDDEGTPQASYPSVTTY